MDSGIRSSQSSSMPTKEQKSDAQVEFTHASHDVLHSNLDAQEGEQKVTIGSIVTVTAICTNYFGQTLHVVGAGFLGQSIISVVGGQDKTVWLTLILTIPTVLLGPAASQCADFWGRKWPLVVSSYISVIGCIVFGRATSIGMAIAAQVVASAAYIYQSTLHAVVSEVLPRKYRPMAQMAVNLAAGSGAITGLYAGGALCKNNPNGFRAYMYMAAGIYFTAGTLILLTYQPRKREQQKLTLSQKLHSLDIPAMLLTIVALLTFCVGLGYSYNPYLWKNAHVLAPFLTGIVCIIGLVCYAVLFQKHGLFDHDLFKSRNYIIASVGLFVEGFSFFAANNYYGFQVSFVYGQNLFQTGLVYSITWYTYLITAIFAGIYCSRTKTIKIPAFIAYLCFLAFFICMSTTNASTHLSLLWGYSVFLGVGLGLALNVLVVVAQLSTPVSLISTATGLIIATRALGSTIALAIYNAIFHATLSNNLVSKILAAVNTLGLPESSELAFVGALTTNNETALAAVPGVNPEIIQAGVLGMKEAYALGFRNTYICAACSVAVAAILILFIKDPKDQFTASIDAPLEKLHFLHHHTRTDSGNEENKSQGVRLAHIDTSAAV